MGADYYRAKPMKIGTDNPLIRSCNCIGPQHGEPLCPCRMTRATIQNGRYVEINDLGPAPKGK